MAAMGRIRQSLAAWLRRHLVDGVTLVALIGCVAGLLAWRQAARRGDGGLMATAYQGATPASGVLRRWQVPAPDVSVEYGPRPPRGAKLLRYEGWIFVPFRGHFVFDLWVRGWASLRIDQTPAMTGRSGITITSHGQRAHLPRLLKRSWLLPRGWHRLAVEVRPDPKRGLLRLLWQPPGRRGDPDYVPPAVLRPGPERPSAAAPPHPHRRDFWVALALLTCVALALGVWLRRPLVRWVGALRTDPQARLDALMVLAVGVAGLAVRLWGLDDAGQTWDEDVYFGAGRNFWLNLLSLDFRPGSWAWNLEHPPVTKYVVGLGSLWSNSMTGPRTLSALMGGATAAITTLVGRDWFRDRRVGLVAGLLVALLPSLVAHGRVAGHEATSVFLYTLTVWLAWRGLQAAAPRWRPVALAGVALGLAVGARLINITALVVVLAVVACVAVRRFRDRLPAFDRVTPLVVLVLISGLTFVLAWPRLWHHPVYHFGELLTYWPPGTDHAEWFLGHQVSKSWAYFPVYAAVTTPVVVLVGLALFLVRLGWRRAQAEPAILAWLVAPLLVTPLVPFCRDGVRYILPIAVPMALAAAVGVLWAVDGLWGRFRKGAPPATLALGVALVGLVAPVAWATWRFQPYQLDYYNALSGGPRAALERRYYEWSWWGEGLGNAVRWINRHGPRTARIGVDVPARHTMVLVPDMRTLPPGTRPRPDYLLYGGDGLRRLWDPKRHRWNHPPGYTVAHEERVAGVPLIRVYRRVP